MTEFMRERGFAFGYAVMLAGVSLLLAGFAVDAWLHAEDPELASKEGIFTLSNPGHLLVAVGLCVTIVGAFIGPYSRWVLAARPTVYALAVPVLALAVAAGASTGFATAINSLSHEEDGHAGMETASASGQDEHASAVTGEDAEAAPAHDSHDFAGILPKHRATVALEESTFHEPENTQPVTAENLAFAEQFLVDAREQTAKYQDVSVARTDGYIQITPDLPLIGAHFFKQGVTGLEPGAPAILLYEDDGAGGWTLAGMSYNMPKAAGDDTPPETALGGLAHWHYHTNLCFLGAGQVTIAADQSQCRGLFVAETDWLLHVWAWKDSPEGVFDHANTLLQ